MKDRIILVEGQISFAQFIERPNRFLVRLIPEESGKTEDAFLHDPGRMKELLQPNAPLLIRRPLNKGTRKTLWDVLAVKHNKRWVIINSLLPNRVAKVALSKGWITELAVYTEIKPEVRYGTSRFDFLLSGNNRLCFVEVKGVTLVRGKRALFPDAPTTRGTRHLQELAKALVNGYQAVVLFIVMRDDPEVFSPNSETDPKFSQQLVEATAAGVEILVYKVKPQLENQQLLLQFGHPLKVEL